MQMSRLINTELKSDSESSYSDLESEKVGARVDNELMTKLESGSDNDSELNVIVHKWLQMIANKMILINKYAKKTSKRKKSYLFAYLRFVLIYF